MTQDSPVTNHTIKLFINEFFVMKYKTKLGDNQINFHDPKSLNVMIDDDQKFKL